MRLVTTAKHHGFTLLELLVAMTVFATMSIMAYGGLTNVINNSDASEQSLKRLHEVQLSLFMIERDLSQITQRNIRDEFGQKDNYIEAGSNIDYLIELSRNGRRNPANILRSHLERVSYKLEEGNLMRLSWPHLDKVQGMEPYQNTLLTDVENAQIRFLDNNKEWHEQWPPLDPNSTTNSSQLLLSGIEFKLLLNDWGEISRLFKANN